MAPLHEVRLQAHGVKFLLMVLLCLAVGACGQKGPLYREDNSSADQVPNNTQVTGAAAQQNSDEKEKKSQKPATSQP